MAGRTSVAVLGAGGTMGLEMTRNLARAGMDVRVEPLPRPGYAAGR
jgi:3-hydroxyisobutyrate dehydrogenase-like beta-hydroxyacid dehydrogenase